MDDLTQSGLKTHVSRVAGPHVATLHGRLCPAEEIVSLTIDGFIVPGDAVPGLPACREVDPALHPRAADPLGQPSRILRMRRLRRDAYPGPAQEAPNRALPGRGDVRVSDERLALPGPGVIGVAEEERRIEHFVRLRHHVQEL